MKKIICFVLAIIMTLGTTVSAVTVSEKSSRFDDVLGTKDAWANEYIEKMADKGVVDGIGDNKFEPSRILKREELAKLIALTLKINTNGSFQNIFEDVSSEDWYASYVLDTYRQGLMKGISENKFGAGEGMKRCDLALIFARTEYKDEELVALAEKLPENIKDKEKIPSYAKGAMGYCYEKGLITGDENGYLNPLECVTRAEACKVLCVFLDLFETTDEPSDEIKFLEIPGIIFENLDDTLNWMDISTDKLSEKEQYNIKAALHNYSVTNFKDMMVYIAGKEHKIYLNYRISEYFGKTSDGYYVFKAEYPVNHVFLSGKVSYKIGGEDFLSDCSDVTVFIYKDGYVYDLKEAFEDKKVDINIVKSASELVMERYKDLKEPIIYEPTKEITPEDVTTEIEKRSLEGVVSAEKEIEIRKALYEYYIKYQYPMIWSMVFNGNSKLNLDVKMLYANTSDDTYILSDLGPVTGIMGGDAITAYRVFDCIIYSPITEYSAVVYKDGQVYDVCTAYSKGIISDNMLKDMYNEFYKTK